MEGIEQFLNNLYSNEYFGFYLIIAIIVLIILFLIILFFGKKDQKVREIEATKKLQQINAEAFKEENTEEKLEINKPNTLEDTIVVPNIEDVPTLNGIEEDNEIPEPVIPMEVEMPVQVDEKIEVPKFEDLNFEINEEPLLERLEEKPLAIDNTNIFNNDFTKEVEDKTIIDIKPIVEPINTFVEEEIEVPKFNFDEIVKEVEEVKQNETYTRGPQIFSSVYVPEKKEEIKEEKIEIPVIEEKKDDLGFELPSLKKEEVKEEIIEKPILTDYNLDELAGESYTINK